jgi:class 3 adenylate cyclase
MIPKFQEAARPTASASLVQVALPKSEPKPDRRYVSLLFGDIVGSTELLAEMGDLNWMEVVSAYYALIRREHKFFGGRYLTTTGDGFLCGFDHATKAVDCALAILRSMKALGLKMRIGVHAGECFNMGEQFVGLAVHVGARIAAKAAANEVLVSDCVKNQIADSDVVFFDRGTHNLKGVPGEWRLFGAS